MIPNLAVDHLGPRLDNDDSLLQATYQYPAAYRIAAAKLGLTAREYAEFQRKLLDGKAVHVLLPQRLDSMSGKKRDGHVYVLRNIQLASRTYGYEVDLTDGKQIYAPDTCGNLSVLNAPVRIARLPRPRRVAHIAIGRRVTYTPAIATGLVPESTPTIVTVAPPVAAPIAVAPVEAAPAAASGSPLRYLIAVPIVGGIIAGFLHSSTSPSTPIVPPCSAGSNSIFACAK